MSKNMISKSFFHICFVFISSLVAVDLCAAVNAKAVVVGYYSVENQKSFEEKIKPLFEKQTSGCSQCQIVNLTPYDDKGEFDMKSLEDSLKKIPQEVKILFFDFNFKKNDVSASIIEQLSQISAQGILVVASAGTPKEQQATSPLSKTLFGQIKNAFIIGDLGERERLNPQGFFGPEMLTAIRSPRDLNVPSVGPLLFASKLATDYSRRSPQEWTGYLRSKKEKSRKIWPDLQDFFN